MRETGHKLRLVISLVRPVQTWRLLPAFALSAGLISSPAAPVAGSYVADRLDGRPVPAELRINSTRGYYRWLHLDQAVLRLQANGRFTISARYDEQLVRIGRMPHTPTIKSESRQGRYNIAGNRITLIPNPTSSDKVPQPYIGTFQSGIVTVAMNVKELTGARTIVVKFRRDGSFW
jgi:hypothetical protein